MNAPKFELSTETDAETRIERTATDLTVRIGCTSIARFQRPSPDRLVLVHAAGERVTRAILLGLHAHFESDVNVTQLELTLDCRQRRGELLARGTLSDEQERFVCRRSTLFQLPELFCHGWRSAEYPLQYVITNGKRHPLRPPKPVGVVYSRYLTELGETISFRALTRDDLCLVHRWMNEPRIAQIWELAGTRDEFAAYLDEVRRDPHTLPLIGCFDDQPFGYFEVYWAKEDRVAPFYPADDYDRGMHVLSGEPRFRGPARVAAWLRSLSHYLFLDEPRTRNLVAEPRIENAKMIQYFSQCGFYKQRRFEFPHKRAAMMIVARDAFFDEHCP